MKRIICIICAVLLLLSFCGCNQYEEKLISPVNFYYLTGSENYEDPAIVTEQRESVNFENDMVGLIELYLKGPETDALRSPFPTGVSVKSITVNDLTVDLRLDETFAQLSDIDMTAACACLTLTLLEMTNRNRLVITAMDASDNIIYTASMTRDQIILTVES